MDPQHTPTNLPFAEDDDAKLEAELADPTPARPLVPAPMPPPPVAPPAEAPMAPPMSPPITAPSVVPPPSRVMPSMSPPQATPPVAPVTKKSGDPEDIFSDLEQKRPLSSMNTVLPPAAHAASGSALKYILMAIGILVLCGAIAGGIWYFAIHRSAQQALQQEVLPPTPAEADLSDDILPPEGETFPADTPVVPPPALPVTPSDAPEFVSSTPVTTPPGGTNVPPPTSISPGTSSSAESTTATSAQPIPPFADDLSRRDTDQDGLTDVRENELGTDPNKADTDGDALNDGNEVTKYRTNPLNPDSDTDGYPDGVEIQKGYSPLGAGACARPDCTL